MTLHDDILFSHTYDESSYNLVIEGVYFRYLVRKASCSPPYSACTLKPDLAILPHGDMTEVGEKGKFLIERFCEHLIVRASCRYHSK